ncbi:Hypothetical_protein [Hexamita inflata]|uniref:Hypothetical_protein n=1 Tax=Hexamita inflata TaxID=28002 RepID=A0AA86P6Y3_9EUKA|nr:Hypothetical protein HINF_LOCUS19673 [Hexamita inflata]
MISQVCEFTNIIYIVWPGVSLKIKLKITIVSSTVINFLFSLLNRYSIRVIHEQPVQERLPCSHTTQLGELLKSLFLTSFPFQINIIWLSLPTKLSEGSRASEFILVFNLVWLSESYFGDQIRQKSENIDFSQKFTDIIKNINIQQQVSKCPKNELQDMFLVSVYNTANFCRCIVKYVYEVQYVQLVDSMSERVSKCNDAGGEAFK